MKANAPDANADADANADLEAGLFAHICAYLVATETNEEPAVSASDYDDAVHLEELYSRFKAAQLADGSREGIRFSIAPPDEKSDEQLKSARRLVERDPYLLLLDRAVGDIEAVLQMARVKRSPGKPLTEADKEKLYDYARFYWPGRKRSDKAVRVSEVPPAAEFSERDDLKRRLTAAFNAFTRSPTETHRDALAELSAEFCDTRPKRSGRNAMLQGGAVDSNRRRH